MRITTFAAGLLMLLGSSGCLSWHVSAVRDTTTTILGCPKAEIVVRETQKGWVAGGCGKSVVCSDTTGPCLPMVCMDVAMTDYRECSDKKGKDDGDCLSVYTNAIRACVLEEVRGMNAAVPQPLPLVVTKAAAPPEPAKPPPVETKPASAPEPAKPPAETKAAATSEPAKAPIAEAKATPPPEAVKPPAVEAKAAPTPEPAKTRAAACTAPQIAEMIKLGLTRAQITAACPK